MQYTAHCFTIMTELLNLDPVWSAWESWSACSKSCGSGWAIRSRECDGIGCDGSDVEYRNCDTGIPCPIGKHSLTLISVSLPYM